MQMWATVAVPFSLGEEDWSIWDYDKATTTPLLSLDLEAVRKMAETEEGVPSGEEREMEEGSHSSGADESSSEEMEQGELFEVERIVSKKKVKGKMLYKVQWKGYSSSNDTWEPVENLGQVLDMIEEFDEGEETKKKERQEQRRLQKLKMEGKLLPGEESPDSDDELYGLRDPFWKLMELGKVDVTQNPDMYSNIKSRAATLASRKEKREEAASTPTSSTPQSEKKEKSRGRGRARGSSRGRGNRGRARGRPPSVKRAKDEDSDSSSDNLPRRTPLSRAAKSKDLRNKSGAKRWPGRDRRQISSSEETSGSYSLEDSDASNISDTSTTPQSAQRAGRKRFPKFASSPQAGDTSAAKSPLSGPTTPAQSPRVALSSLSVSELSPDKASSPPSTSSGEQDSTEISSLEKSAEVCLSEVEEKQMAEMSESTSEATAEDSSSSPQSHTKKGKKKTSPRKRKQADTIAVHAEAVSSGDASPPKMSPSPASSSPAELNPADKDVQGKGQELNDINSGVDESSQEAKLTIDLNAGLSESEDTSLSEAPSSSNKDSSEKKVPPLVIPLMKLQGCVSPTSVSKHKLPAQPAAASSRPQARNTEASRLQAGGSVLAASVVPSMSMKKDLPAPPVSPAQERLRPDAGDVKQRLSSSSPRDSPHTSGSVQDSCVPSSAVKDSSASVTGKSSSHSSASTSLSRDVTSRDTSYQGSASSLSAPKDVSSYSSSSSASSTSLNRDAQASSSSYRDLGIFSRFEVKSTSPVSKPTTVSSVTLGKENTDRQQSVRPGPSYLKKMDSSQPLDAISNMSSFAGDIERASKLRGLDSDFEIALERMDLADIESMLLPPVEPIELTDDGLKRAVMEGNALLVEQALAASKTYNISNPDENGCTLLMHAVLNGYDDIIVQLLFHNADVQAQQKNGVTALMLAVEHAECSTVALLLEMGANINTKDDSGETALIKAVKRGDKQILKLLLENGSNFTAMTSAGYNAIQLAKVHRLADMETTLIDHITRVTTEFEKQVRATLRNTATLIAPLFPHQCFTLYESESNTVRFKYQPNTPAGPGMGFLLFIAHARINTNEVKCRLYGHCAVTSVYLNGVLQPSLTEESNFVLMCHPLFEGYNELVININRDTTSKAKLIVCAYKAQLINSDRQ